MTNCNSQENSAVNVWQETFSIRFGAVDKSDRLTLDAVFNYFQEAAISHAENLGVGRQALAETRQGWILSRLSVMAENRPKYGETITVRTWPKGSEKLFAMRYFDIRNKDNVPVIAAKSAWLVVDIDKRLPLRIQPVIEKLPANEDVETFPLSENAAGKLAKNESMEKITEQKALYTYVDYNGHVNNVSYVKWIEDTLDLYLGTSSCIENAGNIQFDINYLHEILPGQTVEIFIGKTGSTWCFEGRIKETDPEQTAFRAELLLI